LCRNLKSQAHFLCDFKSVFNVFPQLRIPVRNGLVRVTEPETNEIFGRSILPSPYPPVAAEGVIKTNIADSLNVISKIERRPGIRFTGS
jgi:hypothetical protein